MCLEHASDDRAGPLRDAERPVVEAEDQRVATLQRDQRLEHRRCDRIGDRHDAEDHADRAGDFGDLARGIDGQRSLAGLAGERRVHAKARELVLERLVEHAAHPGLCNRGDGQFLGCVRKRVSEIVEEGVDSIVSPTLERLLRAAGTQCHRVHLGRQQGVVFSSGSIECDEWEVGGRNHYVWFSLKCPHDSNGPWDNS